MMFNFLLSLCATDFSSVSRSSLKSSYVEYKNQNMLLSNYILLVLTRCVEFKSKLSFDFCINSTKSRIIILLNFFLCEFVDIYKSRQHSTINLHIPTMQVHQLSTQGQSCFIYVHPHTQSFVLFCSRA